MLIREMTQADIAEAYSLRTLTRENALSKQELEALGITQVSLKEMLKISHKGWVCIDNARMIGFAMGNAELGEMWVIALHPDYEGRGVGKALIMKVQEWLWSKGWDTIWLTTDVDPGLRAYGFYKRMGWVDREIKGGLRYMQLNKPGNER